MIVGKDNMLLFADARSVRWRVVRQAGSEDRAKPLSVFTPSQGTEILILGGVLHSGAPELNLCF